jgi:hypothetical protein
MATIIEARWADWDGPGRQHVVLTDRGDAIIAQGSIASGAGPAWRFEIESDAAWCVRRAEVAPEGGPALRLFADGNGNWFDAAREPMPQLAGALDVDLSATAFTNTLPVRRCNLAIGEGTDIITAYVAFPGLTVIADPQRYTRFGALRYRYDSRDSDFTCDIEVDRHGLVVSYPGLFRRLA